MHEHHDDKLLPNEVTNKHWLKKKMPCTTDRNGSRINRQHKDISQQNCHGAVLQEIVKLRTCVFLSQALSGFILRFVYYLVRKLVMWFVLSIALSEGEGIRSAGRLVYVTFINCT